MAEGIPGGSPASSLLGGRAQAPIMQMPMLAQLLQHSGLGRFGAQATPYRPAPYTQAVYQPQPLPDVRRQPHQQAQPTQSLLLGQNLNPNREWLLGGWQDNSTGGA